MAEAFSNSITRASGIVTSNASANIGVTTTIITGISTVGVAVSNLIINQHFNGGSKVLSIGSGQVTTDTASTNSTAATTQSVKFLGVTTAYTSAAATKSVLIGGTFANNTDNSVKLFVEVFDVSGLTTANLAYDIPVPEGSSFVISDAGKTLLESEDELRIYADTANSIDTTLSVITGVN